MSMRDDVRLHALERLTAAQAEKLEAIAERLDEFRKILDERREQQAQREQRHGKPR